MQTKDIDWMDISKDKRCDIIKYIKLMKRFQSNPGLIGIKHKKWMLSNCDFPTELIPNELLDEEKLWL